MHTVHENAQVYNYFRTYDPSTGRYLESDPIGLDGGLNTYGYAYQNPIVNYDPDGQFVIALANPGTWAALGKAAAYLGSAAAAGWAAANTWDWISDPAEAGEEHDDYKERYNQPMPPGLDPCQKAKWELARERRLLRDMQRWDRRWRNFGAWNKYAGNRHAEPIERTKRAIRNKKKKVDRLCKKQCK